MRIAAWLEGFAERVWRNAWHRAVTAKMGEPFQTIGSGDALRLPDNAKEIRIAPCRKGEQIASSWRFWMHKSEVYAAGRNHAGLHKLSFHESGKWHARLGSEQKSLAPGRILQGGYWRHALQLCYFVGGGVLPPPPEKPFSATKPGYLFEILPGEQLVAHLLIGVEATTLEAPLPAGFEVYSKLFPMSLSNGKCALLIGGQIPLPPEALEPLRQARALRVNTRTAPDLAKLRMEAFSLRIIDESINAIDIIPLGPEAMTTAPRPPDAKSVAWKTVRPR